jgi:hypothetical protein
VYLELDRDNPMVVWVKPRRGGFPWFAMEPQKGLIRIAGHGEREILDIDELERLALELVQPIDKPGNA